MTEALLQLRGITKRFPGVLALDGVDFALTAGEVHALVGENGAGKSTLIKIISGVHQPDAGRIDYLGTPVTFPTPRAAADRGITVIYQEVALFPDLTVLENLYVGAYPRRPLLRHSGRGRRVDWMAMRARAQDVAASLGVKLDLEAPVHRLSAAQPQVLEVEGLGTSGALTDVSFTLGRGEILGLAGLVGSGRTTLARAIFGIVPPGRGRIKLDGVDARIAHAGRARELGIAYVPEERQRQGLVLPFSVSENLSLVILRRLSRLGFINHASERTVAHDVVRRLDIRTPGIGVPAATLSGGNQQKVVVGKWLAAQPRVLIMDEPTRGVDVGAKAEIHRLMSELAVRGLAILLISSELPELLGMSDRIMVMHRGRIAGELSRDQATQEKIMAMATGVA